MSLLDTLLRQGALRPIDHALEQSLRRLGHEDGSTPDNGSDERVLVAAALASSAVAQGHAGLDLAQPQLVCAAEVEFYSHYPQAEGTAEPVEIPAPLYELAEAILKKRHADSASLNALLIEPDLVAEEA